MDLRSSAVRALLPACAGLLAGCAGVQPAGNPAQAGVPGVPGATAAPSLGFFSRIKAPAGYEPVLRLAGRGAQIFRCEAFEGEYLWRFRQPEAELTDDHGQAVARQGANFSFEHRDGSRLTATITAFDDAPRREDLRWLLMSTKWFGKGAFTGVGYVQRINTGGGMPPAKCQAGEVNRLLRVSFTSDFVFYRARP